MPNKNQSSTRSTAHIQFPQGHVNETRRTQTKQKTAAAFTSKSARTRGFGFTRYNNKKAEHTVCETGKGKNPLPAAGTGIIKYYLIATKINQQLKSNQIHGLSFSSLMLFFRLYFRSPYKNSISVQVTCKLLEKSHLLHQRKERSQQISWLLLYFWFLSFFVFKTQIWVLWKQYYILVHSRHMLPPKIS